MNDEIEEFFWGPDYNNLDNLKKIINKLMHKEFIYTQESINYQLTGEYFKFKWIDLVYLLLEIKKKFNIKVDEAEVLNFKFNTINSILTIIESNE